MSVALKEKSDGRILEVAVRGKLTAEDYEILVPEVDRLVEKLGKLRILFEMHDFHGWSAGALWQDIKVDMRHFNDIERLAFVGDKKWEQGMAHFCKPFTTGAIRYFDHSESQKAHDWLEEGVTVKGEKSA